MNIAPEPPVKLSAASISPPTSTPIQLSPVQQALAIIREHKERITSLERDNAQLAERIADLIEADREWDNTLYAWSLNAVGQKAVDEARARRSAVIERARLGVRSLNDAK